MESQNIVDYYQVLECGRAASDEELKKSYKRLVLSSHPDKNECENETFHLIQKAWSVLKDPVSRKQYDAMLSCQEHSECLLYDTVSLSEMEYDPNIGVYSYSCRCGGTYLLSASDSLLSNFLIGCDECSFSIQIKHL